jgi:hypothetical protein
MPTLTKNTIGLGNMIERLKKDLLLEQPKAEPDIFSIDEVTIELNFVIDGSIESGFNLGVVTLGSQVSEERMQKITIKMTPIVSKQQLVDELNSNTQKSKDVLATSIKTVFREDATESTG